MGKIIEFPKTEEERMELFARNEYNKRMKEKKDKDYETAHQEIVSMLTEFYNNTLIKMLENSRTMYVTDKNLNIITDLFESIAYNVMFNYSQVFGIEREELWEHFRNYCKNIDAKQ